MITKTDYLISVLIGFFVGIFIIPVMANVGLRNAAVMAGAPWVVAVAFAAGTWIGAQLTKKMAFFAQFTRFVIVGFLNTAIDFGILNGISLLSGVTRGLIVGGVNIPGVAVAVFNAYFWNKLWVFSAKREGESIFHDFPKFLLVSGIGIFLNSGMVAVLSTYVSPLGGLSEARWLNVAKVFATVVSLIWNFTGYKFIVFKTKEHHVIAPL